MQKEFNKLTDDKKRKFIIRNIMKDKYFIDYQEKMRILCCEYIYTKEEQKIQIINKNRYLFNKIVYILTNYKNCVIDLYCNPENIYFYEKALYYKNKLDRMNYNMKYKDENDFTIFELLLDTFNDIKNIIIKPEISIENIIIKNTENDRNYKIINKLL
jgi:hypothetical protein